MWAQLRSEALVALKRDLYAPMSAAEARLTLESRQLGVSKLRLIPKSKGARRRHLMLPTVSHIRVMEDLSELSANYWYVASSSACVPSAIAMQWVPR